MPPPTPDDGTTKPTMPDVMPDAENAQQAPTISAATARRIVSPRSSISFTFVGLSLAVLLAAGQVVFPPPPVYRGGEATQNRLSFDPHKAPLVGPKDATYFVVLLFDYKCVHCQKLHFLLDEVVRRYGGKLAFVLCPAPLDRQCNPYVPRDEEKYKDACALVKIGLTVWLAKPDAFPTFNRWMFSLESGDLLGTAPSRGREGQSGRIGRPSRIRERPNRPLD